MSSLDTPTRSTPGRSFPAELWNGRERVPVSGYIDDLITDRAIDFVGRHKGQPFFLYLPYVATHFGIAAPADEVSRHRGRLPEADPDVPLNATYAAMVTRLDANVGRLIETLEKMNLANDTLIVFTSDHGATFESGNQGTSAALDSNRPFRGQKRTLWEGGVRVPAVAFWPGQITPGCPHAGGDSPDRFAADLRGGGRRRGKPRAGTSTARICWRPGPARPVCPSVLCSGNGVARGPTNWPRSRVDSSW